MNPACQCEHGDTDRQSHAEEESQEAGAGANDDEDNEDCPKDYSDHGCVVLGVVICCFIAENVALYILRLNLLASSLVMRFNALRIAISVWRYIACNLMSSKSFFIALLFSGCYSGCLA